MAVNYEPLFTGTPQIEWSTTPLTSANTAVDGTGTVTTVFTAGVNGGFIKGLKILPLGTNIQTVLRVFINNGSTNATIDNNTFIGSVTLPASTLTNTAQYIPLDFPILEPLPPGYKVNVVIATAVATGYQVTAFGGSYVKQP